MYSLSEYCLSQYRWSYCSTGKACTAQPLIIPRVNMAWATADTWAVRAAWVREFLEGTAWASMVQQWPLLKQVQLKQYILKMLQYCLGSTAQVVLLG